MTTEDAAGRMLPHLTRRPGDHPAAAMWPARDKYVLIQYAGGEPLAGLICWTAAAARAVAEAMELGEHDFRIIRAREM